MASKRPFSEEDISCPVCCDVFRDPVLLPCSHTACKACLLQFWAAKGARECPMCRKRSQTKEPPLNLVLKNLCDSFLEERQHRQRAEAFCDTHSQQLTLFCRDDETPVCAVCKESDKHTHHSVCDITEAASACKEELLVKLEPMQERLNTLTKLKVNYKRTAKHIKRQTEETERQMKEDFEKLHGFLQEEETTRLAALRSEERQKLQLLTRKNDEQKREISSLSQTIQSIQKDMEKYKQTKERAQCTLQDPERVSGALINVAKHLGNLKFRVWEKMQEIIQYTPVILDPNTAHPSLVLSNDLTTLRRGDRQPLPESPRRFGNTVLGSEGFSCGTQCWDVDVSNSTKWALGVITDSARRRGSPMREGVLMLFHSQQQYVAGYCASEDSVSIIMTQNPQRIRVQLDWDGGELSFSDPDNNTHLHTIAHTFTEMVFPFFSQACKLVPMKLLPVRTSASVQQCRAITGDACLRAEVELVSPHADTATAHTMMADAEGDILLESQTMMADAEGDILSESQTVTTDTEDSQSSSQASAGEPSLWRVSE